MFHAKIEYITCIQESAIHVTLAQ